MKKAIMFMLALLLVFSFTTSISLAGGGTLVTGTGTIQENNITRIGTELNTCPNGTDVFLLVNRTGDAVFSGLLSTEDSTFETRMLVNYCADPTQTSILADYHLTDVTVCGLTGDLDIHVTGFGTGDVSSSDGADSMAHFVITGSGGKLRNAKGEGLIVVHVDTTSALRTYYAEMLLHGNPAGIVCDDE